MGRLWLRLAYGAAKLFFRLCCQVHIEGSEHIPSQGGVVLVSNHISGFDTILLPYSVLAAQGMQIIWAPAKAELFRSRDAADDCSYAYREDDVISGRDP